MFLACYGAASCNRIVSLVLEWNGVNSMQWNRTKRGMLRPLMIELPRSENGATGLAGGIGVVGHTWGYVGDDSACIDPAADDGRLEPASHMRATVWVHAMSAVGVILGDIDANIVHDGQSDRGSRR